MAISREELKAKRQKAVGVVSNSRQATADMYDTIIGMGETVARAREDAQEAHLGDLREQLRDLKEDLEEVQEFAQLADPTKRAAGTAPSAGATTKPGNGSEALAALNAAQPKLDAKNWTDGDAYHGTHPED